jgi:hypothetical protein
MRCQDWELSIALEIEADLPAKELNSLNNHLAHCLACQQFRQTLLVSQQRLKSTQQVELDEILLRRFRADVMRQITTRPPKFWQRWWPNWTNWSLAGRYVLASCLIVALGGLSWWIGSVNSPVLVTNNTIPVRPKNTAPTILAKTPPQKTTASGNSQPPAKIAVNPDVKPVGEPDVKVARQNPGKIIAKSTRVTSINALTLTANEANLAINATDNEMDLALMLSYLELQQMAEQSMIELAQLADASLALDERALLPVTEISPEILAAAGPAFSAPAQIEIHTADPQVRIIWLLEPPPPLPTTN